MLTYIKRIYKRTLIKMAISPPIIASTLLASSPTLKGQSWVLTTNALGLGIFNWINSSIIVNTLCTGTLGAGLANGKVFIIPNTPLSLAGFTANGIISSNATAMASALATCFSILPMQFSGFSPLVGTGSCAIVNIVAPYPTLLASLQTSFPASGIPNPNPLLLNSFALSVSNLFLTGTGIGAVVGSASVVPTTAPIICKIG